MLDSVLEINSSKSNTHKTIRQRNGIKIVSKAGGQFRHLPNNRSKDDQQNNKMLIKLYRKR